MPASSLDNFCACVCRAPQFPATAFRHSSLIYRHNFFVGPEKNGRRAVRSGGGGAAGKSHLVNPVGQPAHRCGGDP